MPKTRPLPISIARSQLFDLFDGVVAGTRNQVLIERRNRSERAVLTSERYLRHLEDQIRDLTHALGRVSESSPPYNFLGSIASELPAEEVIGRNRTRQKRLTDAKMSRLHSELKKRR